MDGHFTERFHASGQRNFLPSRSACCFVHFLSFMVHRLRTPDKQMFTAESLTRISVSLHYERVFQFAESYAARQKLNTWLPQRENSSTYQLRMNMFLLGAHRHGVTCRWTKSLKGKVKFIYISSKAEAVPVRAIKAERRSGDTAQTYLNVGTVWRLVVSLLLRLLSRRGKSSRWVGPRAGLDVLETREKKVVYAVRRMTIMGQCLCGNLNSQCAEC